MQECRRISCVHRVRPRRERRCTAASAADNGTRAGARRATQAEFEAALAAFGDPPDLLGRLALFTVQQLDAVMGAIEAQAKAQADTIALLNARFRLIEGEIIRLQAAQRRSGIDDDDDRSGSAGKHLQ